MSDLRSKKFRPTRGLPNVLLRKRMEARIAPRQESYAVVSATEDYRTRLRDYIGRHLGVGPSDLGFADYATPDRLAPCFCPSLYSAMSFRHGAASSLDDAG